MTGKMRKISFIKVLNIVICMYILTYIFPTGVIAGIPIQKIVVCIFLGMSACVFVQNKKILDIIRNSLLEIVIFLLGFLWCVVSLIRGNTLSIKFCGLLYISVVIFLVLYFLAKYELIDLKLIMQCVLLMMLVKITGKILIEVSFILEMIEYEEVIQMYLDWFGTEVSTMTMHFENLLLIRIQSSSDIIVVTLMPFFWVLPEYGKRKRITFFVLSGIYTLIVFSRVLLIEFCCFAFVAVLFYWKRISEKIRCLASGALLISSVFWIKPVIEMIKFRFFSSFTAESDSVRQIQMEKLIQGITEKPVWGHGMGSYIPDYIRSNSVPFSYEIEYLSFGYQIGIAGFILLIGGIIWIYFRKITEYCRKNKIIIQIFTLICLGWFIVRPAFNPSFLGMQNGFSVIGVLLFNIYYKEKCMKTDLNEYQ